MSIIYTGYPWINFSLPGRELVGKRVGMFSYGSGSCSSMFSLRIHEGPHFNSLSSYARGIKTRLESRKEIHPQQFSRVLKEKEQRSKTGENSLFAIIFDNGIIFLLVILIN